MTFSMNASCLHKPRFCQGSITRHIIVMAGTGTIGLMAVFLVDFLNLFYISRLGNTHYTAAIGFANAINFLQVAVCIGMSIGITVITARLIGEKKHDQANQIIASFLLLMTIIMVVIGIIITLFRYPILSILGAQDVVLEQASQFIIITSPFLFFLGLGMALSGLLRAGGDAKRSMYITLIGAFVTAILDPLIIKMMAVFGSDAVSSQTAIDRIIPVAFAFVFALTGSVGPIISQNYGSGFRDRMNETLIVALKLVCLCVVCAWLFFLLGEEWVIKMFFLKGDGVELMRLFCRWLILGNLFLGMLFVSNTAFNNLGYPLLSTFFNWGRATLGTIPFVWYGATYGPKGILIGQVLGVIPFGIFSVLCAFYVIHHIKITRMID